MMEYKLDSDRLDYGGVFGYYCKGHHDKGEFKSEVDDQWMVNINLENIEHKYMRKVPDSTGEFSFIVKEHDTKSSGAFPVTIVKDF